MKLILVRHGETVENENGIIQGHTDGTLSENGKAQAKKVALRLKDENIDIIYSSDLARASDTAKEIHLYHKKAPIVFVKELRERNYGPFTGMHKSEVDWENMPGAESSFETQERIASFLDKIYKKHPNDCVLFVSHGRVGMALINDIMKNSPDKMDEVTKLNNASVCVFEIKENKKHEVVLLNSVEHLEMKLPTKRQCIEFYRELNTPDNIMRHVALVNKVAVFLAKELSLAGVKINMELVDRASFLHDLDKVLCIKDKSLNHGFVTEKILSDKGFPEVGFYARQHRSDLIVEILNTWEEKVVCYADSRVLHDKLVSVKERFDDLNIRYPPKNLERRRKTILLHFTLEKEIFDKLSIRPEDLNRLIQ